MATFFIGHSVHDEEKIQGRYYSIKILTFHVLIYDTL